MQRSVTSALRAQITSPAEIALSVMVSKQANPVQETLSITVDGASVEATEVEGAQGSRWHLLKDVPSGQFAVDYQAVVESGGESAELTAMDRIHWIRPSRYVDVDRLENVSRQLFGNYQGKELVLEVANYVNETTAYILGSSRVTDGASETFMSKSGVCRDFAHLTIAFLRARGVPARLVSAYAPGLSPMDFHAVVEAHVEGQWFVVDPTRLAPRASLVRIATGADASETAFLTTHSGGLRFNSLNVTAVAMPGLLPDNHDDLISLG